MLQQMPIMRRNTEESASQPSRRLQTGTADLPLPADLMVTRPAFLPHETDDTLLTGGTRSLNRRLLALNLDATLVRPQPGMQGLRLEPLGRTA